MKALISAAALAVMTLAPTASAKELTAGELRKFFPGSYSVTIFNSFTLNVRMSGNGVITGVSRGKRDSGRWSIEGSQLCVSWSNWTKGRKGCSVLRRDGDLLRGRGFYFKV